MDMAVDMAMEMGSCSTDVLTNECLSHADSIPLQFLFECLVRSSDAEISVSLYVQPFRFV